MFFKSLLLQVIAENTTLYWQPRHLQCHNSVSAHDHSVRGSVVPEEHYWSRCDTTL